MALTYSSIHWCALSRVAASIRADGHRGPGASNAEPRSPKEPDPRCTVVDRRCDHKQRRHGGPIGIGAQAPVRSHGDDPVRTLVGTEPTGRAGVALGAPPDVHPAELRYVQGGERAARGKDFALASFPGSLHRKSPVTDVSNLVRRRRSPGRPSAARSARPWILPLAMPRPKRREAAPRRRKRRNGNRPS